MLGDEIHDRAKELSGAEKGGVYLGSHASAWSQIIEELPKETKEEYEDLAEKWNRLGPPPEVQKRYNNTQSIQFSLHYNFHLFLGKQHENSTNGHESL
jgi:hypothetical protein